MQLVSTVPERVQNGGKPPGTRGGGPRWTVDDPPAKIKDFVQWYCHDRDYGQTFRHYAETIGYNLVTIQNWMKDPRVVHLLEHGLSGTNAGPVKVQAVLDMLHRRATQDDDVKAARTYLEAVGKMMPRKTEVDITITDARSLSDEQLRAELKRAVALLEARKPAGEIAEAEVIEDSTDQG